MVHVLLLFLLWAERSLAQIDQTIIPETFGAEVVEAAIEKIKFTCIFPDDSEFARRMAYVETNDGQVIDTYPDDYPGGIWKIDEYMYDQTKNPTNQETFNHINAILTSSELYNIDWMTTDWEDLRKPLYSALAAKLYMFDQVGRDYPIPRDIEGQADFWVDYIRPTGDPDDFELAANTLQENCDTATGADIVFVLDSSGSITAPNFDLIKDFVYQVVDKFDVQEDKYRIGVQRFSSSSVIEFFLNTYFDKDDVLQAIEDIFYDGGGTNTADALNDLVDLSFQESNGARGQGSFQQIAFVLTDGVSNSEQDTIDAAQRVHDAQITTFAISVGSSVRESELSAIASDPDCIHLYALNNFDDFDKIIDAIEKSTCNAPRIWNSNDTITGEFLPGEGINCQVTLPDEGATVKVESTEVPVNYYIATDSYPSPAFYEELVIAYPDQTAVLFLNGTLAELIYCHILNNGSVADNITIGVIPGVDFNCENITCENGGACNELILDDTWVCVCAPGFEGQYCEMAITTTTITPPTTTTDVPTTTTANGNCDYCNDGPCDCEGIYAPNPCPPCAGTEEGTCHSGNLRPHYVFSDGSNEDRFCQCDGSGGCFEFDCQDGLIYLECINACAFPGTSC